MFIPTLNFLSSSSFCARTTICFHQSCTFRNRIRIKSIFLLRYPLKLRKTKNERPKSTKTHTWIPTYQLLRFRDPTYIENNDNSSKIFPYLTSKNKSLLLLLSFWEFVLPPRVVSYNNYNKNYIHENKIEKVATLTHSHTHTS